MIRHARRSLLPLALAALLVLLAACASQTEDPPTTARWNDASWNSATWAP